MCLSLSCLLLSLWVYVADCRSGCHCFTPFPGQLSCSCFLIHSARIRCNSFHKLESRVPQIILSLIRRSFMSLKLHVDARILSSMMQISPFLRFRLLGFREKYPAATLLYIFPKYFSQLFQSSWFYFFILSYGNIYIYIYKNIPAFSMFIPIVGVM